MDQVTRREALLGAEWKLFQAAHNVAPTKAVIPRERGYPVRCGLSYQFYHNRSGILDHPLEPVIGRGAAPTRWRMMISRCAATPCPSLRRAEPRSLADQLQPIVFRKHGDAEFARLGELGAGILTGDDIIGLLRYRARDLGAETLRHRLGFVAGEFRQRPREHHRLAGNRRALAWLFGRPHLDLAQQFAERLDVARFGEKLDHRIGDDF